MPRSLMVVDYLRDTPMHRVRPTRDDQLPLHLPAKAT